ncbi:Chemotaxis phosphatase, CheZ [Limimonas halophila]|uniref:Chemotaxis phosphatase, CheZ n=1 Tax=Limimonas halophila TaxID=1082479 RepID=A0A1G7RZN3_9PROT|nr:hypothetical protein [Limimonas halophila]SDG16218.1 Chemotaxis phosphatase, CheZ [Limimonas halophila]
MDERDNPADPADLRQRLDSMERFMTRRFDELSAEVNAASQLIGMAEDTVKARFGEVIELIEAISRQPDGQGQAGVELDAVVKITEDAANRILDAVDRIAARLDDERIWADPEQRQQALSAMRDDVQEILMACSFQDLTSQRIRAAMANLEEIEDRLSSTLTKFGIDAEAYQTGGARFAGRVSSQGEIDQLFNEGEQPPAADDGARSDSTPNR